jgi:hypothetical protein
MAELHLPSEHSDADLALAHRVAEAMESGELHVAWTHEGGSGQLPVVRARVREAPNPLVEMLSIVLGWVSNVVEAVVASRRARGGRPAPPAHDREQASV